jgi:predicted  nucleic acid-binding Zn-ribbon protein|nr:MAG TPA: Minor structural protein [Caudoviricetes sp.]
MKILDTAMTEIVKGNSARYYSKYAVEGKEYIEALNNFKFLNMINPNNEITIGNTCSSGVTFSIYMPTIGLENKEITIFEGVKVGTEIKYIKLGIFTVTKQTSDGEYTSYEAYDRMYKADMPYFSDMAFPSTDKAILNEICGKLGIYLATNIVTAHTISDKPQGYTYREIIGYMAMLQGCNAVINSDGNLELRWYKDSGYVLDGHKYYQQGVTFTTSKDFILQKLTCNNTKSGSTEQSEITVGDGATGLTFTNPFMTQAILDEVYKKIGGFTFRPLTVKFVGDYRLEVGDIITVSKGDVDYKVPIMQITHECDGGLMDTVTSIGQSDTENTSAASGPITKQMERYYADLITVNKALINKLDVGTAKITYATIDFANVKKQVVDTSLIRDGAVTNEKVQSLSANKLTAGTIDASKITVTNLNADNITVGTINGKRIGTGSLSLDKLAEKVPTKEYLDKVQEDLQGQIDGNIETFTKTEIPTLNNEPAVNWSDDATRKKHIGDICYVVNPASSADGYSYRFADTGTLEAPNYEWVLIKDSDVTKALQDIININGEITGIKKFDVEISSWKTDTDSELSSLKTRTTTLETDMGNKVDTKTFNEVKQAVDGNSSTITKLTKTLNDKADGSTVEALTNTVNTIKQTADSNSLSISGLYTEQGKLSDTIDEVNTKASDAQDWCQNIEDNLSENYTKTTFMNNAITQAVTAESNSIRADVSATYATKDSLKDYATSASLELYIKKDPTTGELKSAIEAIADTINITARGGLNISGDRFTLASTNTTITADGTITSKGTGVGSDGNEYSMAATMRGGELKVWNNTSNNGVRIQGHALLGYDDDGTNTIKVVYTPSDEDDMTTGFWLYSNLGQEASITRKQIWLQGNNSDGSIYGYCNIGKGYVRIDSSGKTYYTDCELSVMGTAKINNLNINGSTKFTSDLSAIQIWNQYFGYCQPVTASTNRVTLTWTDSELEVWVDNTLVGTLFG